MPKPWSLVRPVQKRAYFVLVLCLLLSVWQRASAVGELGGSIGGFVTIKGTKDGLASVPISVKKIAALPVWQTSEVFDARERLVLAYADRLVCHGGRVPDALFAQVKATFSDEEVLELTYITCLYDMHAVMCRAMAESVL